MIRKFSKVIVENSGNLKKMSIKDSIKKLISYIDDSDEESHFVDHIAEYIGRQDSEQMIIEWKSLTDSRGYRNFDDVISFLESYGVHDHMRSHIYYHILYLESFINNVAGKALNKINN